jgi:5-formyltetrahydrofolate cyclo-ligase
MVVPPLSKQALRQSLKERRDTGVSLMTTAQRDDAAAACWNVAHSTCSGARAVAVYLPIGSEMGTAAIIAALHKQGTQIALPHVTSRTSPLRFCAWSPGQNLAAGPFGLQQPPDDAPELTPDIILTPLLGFDRAGRRIGYGAGHYDRAFAAHPHAQRVGIAWSFQQIPHVPIDPWDVPLHAIATECEWITP